MCSGSNLTYENNARSMLFCWIAKRYIVKYLLYIYSTTFIHITLWQIKKLHKKRLQWELGPKLKSYRVSSLQKSNECMYSCMIKFQHRWKTHVKYGQSPCFKVIVISLQWVQQGIYQGYIHNQMKQHFFTVISFHRPSHETNFHLKFGLFEPIYESSSLLYLFNLVVWKISAATASISSFAFK